MLVVTPIHADALRSLFEAEGWECFEEHEFFLGMCAESSKEEPFYIPRKGSVVPVETMEQAAARLGHVALVRGLTPATLAAAASSTSDGEE